MLKGIYVFKQNGLEIGRSENVITTNGKNAIIQYLANTTNDWASAISIGGISTTESASDTNLYYEFARTAVTLKSYSLGSPNLIIVKGTIDSSVYANIYEIGIYPANTGSIFGTRDRLIVEDFSNLTNWTTSSGTAYTSTAFSGGSPYSPRFGANSISMSANSTITNTFYSTNLSSYSSLDTIDILANVASGKSGTLTLTLTDINGNTASFATYTFGSTTGYQIISLPMPSNIFGLSTVSTIQIQTSGTNSAITLDVIRVGVKAELTPSTSLVSRSALTTPIVKNYGTPLDIEYYLQIS